MKRIFFLIMMAFLLIIPKTALALPSLQVYIPGSTAGTSGEDEDTWFGHVLPGTFQLYVVGSYGPNDVSITNGKLLVTVPEDQTGGIISGLGTASTRYDNLSFLPTNMSPNLGHFPLNKPLLYDFYTFDIGSFGKVTTGLSNYNADGGIISFAPNAVGEVKIYTVTASGYDYIHLDAYAKFNNEDWRANQGSHDSSANTPEPATMLLFSMGALGFGIFRRKRSL
jgi:hypothetical protein